MSRTRVLFLACQLAGVLPAAELPPLEQRIAAEVLARQEAAVALLGRTVDQASATENHAGVKAVGELYARELRTMGFETRWVDQASVGRSGHLVAEHRGDRGRRLLLIGHLDTVLQGEPFRREGGRAFGSGVSDMKGGNLIMLEALRALHAAGALAGRQVIVFLTGDEEDTGKPYEVSRKDLLEAARRSDAALAFEGYEAGVAATGRRGFSSWRLEVAGSQGHSSGIFGKARGSGAIYEAARILAAFHAQLPEPYLTCNPSVILGGTEATYDPPSFSGTARGKTNVVPGKVVVEGDLRFLSRDQLARAREKMRAIAAASLPRTSATLSFTDGMPAMAPSEGNARLLAVLDACSRDLGYGPMSAHDPGQRGAGDISFVAELLPCLDGLGADGGKEHAPGEFIELASLPMLTRRAALLMHRVMDGAGHP
ncbi:MAG: M20/M25/M40 family metallo-hydrolase [Acidobacteria bacterium]|nr:M20/M25/M40 family metallo-hydrolase [Acidobacteriota bacterium]